MGTEKISGAGIMKRCDGGQGLIPGGIAIFYSSVITYYAFMLRFIRPLLGLSLFIAQGALVFCEDVSAVSIARDEKVGEPAKNESSFTPVGGGIEVDLKQSILRVPIELVGKGNEKDPSRTLGLEFLVTIGKDKDYESMFSSESRGQHLHMALLMIGREPSKSESSIPASANLVLEIELGEDRRPAENWVFWSDSKPVKSLKWYFRGSQMVKVGKNNHYAADEALNLVAAMPSPTMVVGPGVAVGNPYNEEDVYLVPSLLPKTPIGTKGWLWIRGK
jgi:hypothetical protein